MDQHPGIVFRSGPAGWRAALAGGPDVWEVIATLKIGKARGDEAVSATAELLALTEFQVRIAVRYYSAFTDEIDRRIALNTSAAAYERMGAMEGQITPEPPSEEGFADLLSRAEEGPVVMLNLLSFKPDGGRERYLEYGAAVLPLLERAGGQVVFQGEASPVVLGGESWDLVLLVEYPTRRAFLEMVQSPEYQAIAHLRTEALAKGELHPLDR